MHMIRLGTLNDLKPIMEAFDYARRLMRSVGNTTQWINGYPSEALMREEIEARHCWICQNEAGDILGSFCFILDTDPTYTRIYDGAWLNDAPYAVVHRLATNGKQRGVADECLKWCFEQHPNIRIDTHRDNLIMQHILQKQGYRSCGIIFVADGTERLAYQKCV